MKRLAMAAALAAAGPAGAQSQPATVAKAPVTIESYYRIRWGSFEEFMTLYRRNHAPILEEMRRQGFFTAVRIEEPFTHMAGDQRWDLRVTLTYRDAESAVGTSGVYERAAAPVIAKLYPDRAAHRAAEARRFSLLEEHWDVIVTPVPE